MHEKRQNCGDRTLEMGNKERGEGKEGGRQSGVAMARGRKREREMWVFVPLHKGYGL